jgi:hypothetical protein
MNLAQLISGAKWTPPQPVNITRFAPFADENVWTNPTRNPDPKVAYSQIIKGCRLATEQVLLNIVLPCFSFTEWRPREACPGFQKDTIWRYIRILETHGYLEVCDGEGRVKLCRRLK